MLSVAEPFLEQQMHPTTIIAAYRQALDDMLTFTKEKIGWAILCCVSLASSVSGAGVVLRQR